MRKCCAVGRSRSINPAQESGPKGPDLCYRGREKVWVPTPSLNRAVCWSLGNEMVCPKRGSFVPNPIPGFFHGRRTDLTFSQVSKALPSPWVSQVRHDTGQFQRGICILYIYIRTYYSILKRKSSHTHMTTNSNHHKNKH